MSKSVRLIAVKYFLCSSRNTFPEGLASQKLCVHTHLRPEGGGEGWEGAERHRHFKNLLDK